MFGVESKELLIILFAVLILFGPKRIPEVARALGKGLGDVRDALSGIERDVRHATDSLTAPETRPIPGVGSRPATLAGGPSAGATAAADASKGSDLADYGDASERSAAADGSGAAMGNGAADGSSTAEGREAADSRAVPELRPVPGPGPGLAG